MSLQELKTLVSSHFEAPVFDENEFAAALIKDGKKWSEIATAVKNAKKAFAEKNPAPQCNVQLVKDYITRYRNQQFIDVCGFDANESDGKVYTYNNNALVSENLPVDATNAQIVNAIFSYRFVIEAKQTENRIAAERQSMWFVGMNNVIRGAKSLGLSLEETIERIQRNWDWIGATDTKTEMRIKNNIIKSWETINQLNNDILITGCNSAKGNKLIAKREHLKKCVSTLVTLLEKQ